MKDITIEEAISQVNDFIKDREFFIENDDDNDDEVEVFKKDTQASWKKISVKHYQN